MNRASRPQAGFSLLEMVIVVVILGIASVAVATMVSHVGSGQTENKDLQVGAQLLQECGEWIVSNHRRDEDFYTNVLTGTSSTCFSGPAAFGSFTQPSVSVATVAAGTGGCPTWRRAPR